MRSKQIESCLISLSLRDKNRYFLGDFAYLTRCVIGFYCPGLYRQAMPRLWQKRVQSLIRRLFPYLTPKSRKIDQNILINPCPYKRISLDNRVRLITCSIKRKFKTGIIFRYNVPKEVIIPVTILPTCG